jgi:CRISPR/Cas system endoribonuclease Cas6 (RAMP superfamily)
MASGTKPFSTAEVIPARAHVLAVLIGTWSMSSHSSQAAAIVAKDNAIATARIYAANFFTAKNPSVFVVGIKKNKDTPKAPETNGHSVSLPRLNQLFIRVLSFIGERYANKSEIAANMMATAKRAPMMIAMLRDFSKFTALCKSAQVRQPWLTGISSFGVLPQPPSPGLLLLW